MEKRVVLDGDNQGEKLQTAHSMLDRRVRELDRRAFLTPAEQHELAQLKKQKLVIKDQIRASQPPPEPMS